MTDQKPYGRPLDGVQNKYSWRGQFQQLEGNAALPKDERHEEVRQQALAAFHLMLEFPNCIEKECFTSLQRHYSGGLRMSEIEFGDRKGVDPHISDERAQRIEALLHTHPLGSATPNFPQDTLSLDDNISSNKVLNKGAHPELMHYLLDANTGRVYEFQQNGASVFANRVEIGSLADIILENAEVYGIGYKLDTLRKTAEEYGQSPKNRDQELIKTPEPEPLDIPKLKF